ncbi:hypothetical protein CDL15_Pgr010795 [Punica granatum]|uniref:Uncharacterized protein n=1 Tax=Punica granatum TaxID=22663 RepID=A0A218W4S7_PUNGR|nr:hypothetical protein CDL15_Pgr010795 [Punica granatum]
MEEKEKKKEKEDDRTFKSPMESLGWWGLAICFRENGSDTRDKFFITLEATDDADVVEAKAMLGRFGW